MGRPLGVTILGAGMILAGLGFAAAGVVFFFMGSTGATATAPENGGMATLACGARRRRGSHFSALRRAARRSGDCDFPDCATLARVLTIFLFLLIAAGACLGLIATLVSYSHVGFCGTFPSSRWICWRLWYLLRPATKEASTRSRKLRAPSGGHLADIKSSAQTVTCRRPAECSNALSQARARCFALQRPAFAGCVHDLHGAVFLENRS